jgi:hypothetical protein
MPATTATPGTPVAEPLPAVGKPPFKLSELTTYELRDYRRALEEAVASAATQAPARVVMQGRLDAVAAEQDDRAQLARAHLEPDVDEIRGSLEHSRHLRMALDLLEENLPGPYNCDGLMAELWALREKLAAAELARLRSIGQREYLVIQPLAPAAAQAVISRAAEAVKTLDDLGLLIRLV